MGGLYPYTHMPTLHNTTINTFTTQSIGNYFTIIHF